MKSFLSAALVLLMAATSFAAGEFSTGAAEFAVGDGFVRTVRPAVRYDMVNPSTNLAVGADEPENNVNVIDFCVAMDLTSSKNTLMLGARSYSYENEDVDGYTNMYLNWRMNF